MDVAELKRLVEDKFAPEPLLAVQALVNSYSIEHDGTEEELIGTPEEARDWLVRTGIGDPAIKVSPEEHGRLLALRRAVTVLIDANATGETVAGGAGLAEIAAAHPVPYAVGDGGVMRLDLTPRAGVDGVISQMLGIVAGAQERGEWARLKICASDECLWAFYDSSRNRGGTWCDMEVCGNKMNNRTYRERRAAARG